MTTPTSTGERDALLAAVFAAPDDDVPRLVFADWLDDHGEPDFAAFIRTEVERDRLDPAAPRRRDLDDQAAALRRQGAFPGDVADLGILAPTRRGFHHAIQASPLRLAAGLDRIGPYAPRLDVVLGADTYDAHEALYETADGGPDRLGDAVRAVFASPWVRQWVSLEMHRVPMSADLVRAMADPGHLVRIRQLVFAGGLDDEAVRALGAAEFPRLEVLAVHELSDRDGSRLTVAAVDALGSSPLVARVEALSLMGEWVGDTGIQFLAAAPSVAGLKSLRVWTRGHTPEGLRALIESPALVGLTDLDLTWMPLDRTTEMLLARPDVLPNLRQLSVTLAKGVRRTRLQQRFGDGLVVDGG